ncbi:hypothetical protein AAF712_012946 [Marasmius tenuissimus]|uniref:Uncharacterized protein n=1 Tax=Marasmius tenuissimus TaxID=585030 RepID=A0ABR2ZGC3_9AGAR
MIDLATDETPDLQARRTTTSASLLLSNIPLETALTPAFIIFGAVCALFSSFAPSRLLMGLVCATEDGRMGSDDRRLSSVLRYSGSTSDPRPPIPPRQDPIVSIPRLPDRTSDEISHLSHLRFVARLDLRVVIAMERD